LLRACDRLNRSRLLTAESPVDASIELCIALESLFGGARTDSVAHKVATRCARWIRSGLEDRARVCLAIKKCYSIRSKAVHGGSGQVDRDFLATCGGYITESALAIASRGQFPSDDELDFAP